MATEFDPTAMLLANGRNNEEGCGGGSWAIIFIVLILAAFGGWGNRGGAGCGEGVTQAELCNSMNFNDLANSVGRLSDATAQGFTNIYNGICTSEYRNLELQNQTQAQIAAGFSAAQLQNSQCCCDLQNTIHTEAEATRQLIQQNEIQALRDKICNLENQAVENRLSCQIAGATANVVRYPSGLVYNAGPSPFAPTTPATTA